MGILVFSKPTHRLFHRWLVGTKSRRPSQEITTRLRNTLRSQHVPAFGHGGFRTANMLD